MFRKLHPGGIVGVLITGLALAVAATPVADARLDVRSGLSARVNRAAFHDEMRKLWKFADANGFDWFSVSDHFQESPPRGGDMDCYEAIATLTAAAMDTTKVRLGSGIRTLTAVVTLAADGWFELNVLQIPGLVVHTASLDRAPDAVRKAACKSTGSAPWEFDVQVQW